MEMKKYDSYKNPNVEWIDRVPSQWHETRIKYLATETGSLFLDGDWIESNVIIEEGIRYITTGNIKQGYYSEQGSGFISEETFEKLNCTEVFEGDLLISRLNLPIGRACIIPDLGSRIVTSVDNVIFRPNKNNDKRYLKYLFSSKEYFEHTELIARGATMQRISRGLLGNMKICTPSLEEQTQIANYLDHKTSKIDDLISKKEQLIELLKEERTAIINQAVTKGLDPNVPMKDSGIEWLGEIPEGWEVKKVKHLFKNRNSTRIPLSSEERGNMVNREYDYYGASGVIDKVESFLFDDENILIGEDGANLLTRSKRLAFIASGKYWVNNHAHIIQPKTGNINFYCELLEAIDYSIWVSGSAQPKLTQEALMNIHLVEPPIEEQDIIADYIKSQNQRLDSIELNLNTEIELLKEYKTALISEVVTGKVDVSTALNTGVREEKY